MNRTAETFAPAQAKIAERSLADLQQLVHNYNHTQGMACTGVRMDPYAPCSGAHGKLCANCPRKKGIAITTTTIPG